MQNLIAVYVREPLKDRKLECIVPEGSEAHQYYQYKDRKYRADHIADLRKPMSDFDLIYRIFGKEAGHQYSGSLQNLADDRVCLSPWQLDIYDIEGLDALRTKLLERYPSLMDAYREENIWHIYRRSDEKMDFQEFCKKFSDEDIMDLIYRGTYHLYQFEPVKFLDGAPDDFPGETD